MTISMLYCNEPSLLIAHDVEYYGFIAFFLSLFPSPIISACTTTSRWSSTKHPKTKRKSCISRCLRSFPSSSWLIWPKLSKLWYVYCELVQGVTSFGCLYTLPSFVFVMSLQGLHPRGMLYVQDLDAWRIWSTCSWSFDPWRTFFLCKQPQNTHRFILKRKSHSPIFLCVF